MSYQIRKDEVWNKGSKIRGKNPELYRKDNLGNEMYYPSYGKNSEKGWVIDHSKPLSKGGTDHLNNLQPLNTKANLKKSNKY
jgi:5-methylcytosine-specific restriction endonuclease McrA